MSFNSGQTEGRGTDQFSPADSRLGYSTHMGGSRHPYPQTINFLTIYCNGSMVKKNDIKG